MKQLKYPTGIKQRPIRAVQPSKKNKSTNKYGAKKTVVNGIKFDSKAEAEYYRMLKRTGVTNFKMQEVFVLQDKFRIEGKSRTAITYKPDFTFYDDEGKLIKVVDVKGKRTETFNLKAKLFMKRYDIALVIAEYDYKTGMFREKIA